uniref:CDC42 small effector protein 2-like protein n=1 Tax=Callorhinchus milii TaxID=7868 RepID=V9LBY7_CALMI
MCDSWFSCCVSEAPQPRKRPRIDRSMIGEPMNFMHTAHVGSGDMSNTIHSNVPQWSVQEQMKSKGGYMEQGDVKTQMIDTKAA